METQKMTVEEMKKRIELLKNSKNPMVRRVIAMAEKKVIDMEALKGKEE